LEQIVSLKAFILVIDLESPSLLFETYKTLTSIPNSYNINSCSNLLVECISSLVECSDEIDSSITNIFMDLIIAKNGKGEVWNEIIICFVFFNFFIEYY
jgi:hypothetical protein